MRVLASSRYGASCVKCCGPSTSTAILQPPCVTALAEAGGKKRLWTCVRNEDEDEDDEAWGWGAAQELPHGVFWVYDHAPVGGLRRHAPTPCPI